MAMYANGNESPTLRTYVSDQTKVSFLNVSTFKSAQVPWTYFFPFDSMVRKFRDLRDWLKFLFVQEVFTPQGKIQNKERRMKSWSPWNVITSGTARLVGQRYYLTQVNLSINAIGKVFFAFEVRKWMFHKLPPEDDLAIFPEKSTLTTAIKMF